MWNDWLCCKLSPLHKNLKPIGSMLDTHPRIRGTGLCKEARESQGAQHATGMALPPQAGSQLRFSHLSVPHHHLFKKDGLGWCGHDSSKNSGLPVPAGARGKETAPSEASSPSCLCQLTVWRKGQNEEHVGHRSTCSFLEWCPLTTTPSCWPR